MAPLPCSSSVAAGRCRLFPAADDATVAGLALRALGALLADGRVRELLVARVDGQPVAESPWRPALLEAGFVPGYRGLALRAR